jgi:hypothetical protein
MLPKSPSISERNHRWPWIAFLGALVGATLGANVVTDRAIGRGAFAVTLAFGVLGLVVSLVGTAVWRILAPLHSRLRPQGRPPTLGQQVVDLACVLTGAVLVSALVAGVLWWMLGRLESLRAVAIFASRAART